MTKSGMFVGIAIMLGLFVFGCNDSGSNASRDGKTGHCEVVSKNPLLIESLSDGVFAKTLLSYKDEKVVQLVTFNSADAANIACPEYEEDPDYGVVECKGKTIRAFGREEMTLSEYVDLVKAFVSACGDSIELDDIYSSVEPDLDEDDESSSSEDSRWNDEDKSSSSVSSSSKGNPWSSDAESSSSVMSSPSTMSSSSIMSSSSSESLTDGLISWYGGAWYKKEKVVAGNAEELNCTDNTDLSELEAYDVAYEFNRPGDLGRDYLGSVNAYIEEGMSPLSAECGSLVLDGTNGLLVPLNDVFKTRGFVIEIRFMPTMDADLGNIFVAEPPGRGPDAWQIRMDGTTMNFHLRDGDIDEATWEVLEVGDVELNEWHVIRIKVFPTKSANGDVFYSLNASLDGSLRLASEFKRDLSGLMYGLGIGYDAVHQGAYARKFFTGKIDYIRYGRILEDDL